jgi:hypothetical protein
MATFPSSPNMSRIGRCVTVVSLLGVVAVHE